MGILEPLRELTTRAAFTQRVAEAGEGETRAAGTGLSEGEILAVAEAEGDVLPGGASAGIEFSLVETTTWPGGFCSDGTITNTSDAAVTWSVRGRVSGDITSIWNAEYTIDGEDHVFTGVEWNAELPPFGSTTFGFCGSR